MELLVAVLDLARRQHGWVRTGQVLDLGAARSTFHDWCRAGMFVAGPRGLWRATHVVAGSRTPIMLGVLATGVEAAATAEAGLFLHGVLDRPPDVVRVVHPMARAGARHLGDVDVRVVPSRTLRMRDVTATDGVRVATCSRCLVDACHRPWPTVDHVRSLLIRALQRRRTTLAQVQEQLDNCQHVKGIRVLRLAVQQVDDSGADSYFTHEVWARLVAEGFPVDERPRTVPTPDRVLHPDITLRDGAVCVECDGLAFHADGRALMIDNRKDRAYRNAGREPVRISWLEFTTGWPVFASDLRAALARARQKGAA